MSSSSLSSTPSKRKSTTLQVVESALQILDQVSELTLEDETLITGSLQQEQPLQLEQFQTPQVRKRSLSFVVTPPRLHLKDCFSQEVKPEDSCVMRGSLPLLPDSPDLDASDRNLFGRHRPLHSPMEGAPSFLDMEFLAQLQQGSRRARTPRLVLSTPAPPTIAMFPPLDDADADRPRDALCARALKMRRRALDDDHCRFRE